MKFSRLVPLAMAAVLLCPAARAGDARGPRHFAIDVEGLTGKANYYMMMPRNYDPAKRYPLLIVIPGSHSPEGDTAMNQGVRGVTFWTNQGFDGAFVISVWYQAEHDAHPFYAKPNSLLLTDAMIRHCLGSFPIDHDKVFIQCFSAGGLLVRDLMEKYSRQTPVRFAGMLFTGANCRGGNANTACVTPETAIFIGAGELDRPPVSPWDCVAEAERWKSIFQRKCPDLTHIVFEGVAHTISKEFTDAIKQWLPERIAKIDQRQIERASAQSAAAARLASSGNYGAALVLSEGAINHQVDDNPAFARAKAVAVALDRELSRLRALWTEGRAADPERAYGALLTIIALFRGHPSAEWAAQELNSAQTSRELMQAFMAARRGHAGVLRQEREALRAAVANLP